MSTETVAVERPLSIDVIAHVLGRGGAEQQLLNVARGLAETGNDVRLVVLRGGGALDSQARATGIPVVVVGRGRYWFIPALWRIPLLARRRRADTAYGFLPVANMAAVYMRIGWRQTAAVMGFRGAAREAEDSPKGRAAVWLEGRLARFAAAAIANSEAAKDWAVSSRGFASDRIAVVPNAIDTTRFQPSSTFRSDARTQLGIPRSAFVVGRVANLRAVKDYPTFLEAAALVARRVPDTYVVCVGGFTDGEIEPLREKERTLGLAGKIVWTGARDDVHALMCAFDVAASSSRSESSPNAVAEAMACGVPCVVTDVGDSAKIVGDTGAVVQVGAPDELADAILELRERIEREGGALAEAARARIADHFGTQQSIALTQRALRRSLRRAPW